MHFAVLAHVDFLSILRSTVQGRFTPSWAFFNFACKTKDATDYVLYIRNSLKVSPEFAGINTGIAIVNKETYIDTLRRLMDAIRRKRSDKWRTSSRFLLHDNAPAHRSVLVKDFLAKNKVITLEHSPYSPHLVQLILTFLSTEIRIVGMALL